MFHATLLMIPTCFIHIICHYYAFSGTNLLTRCRKASCCFLLFLVPERLFGQYSRNSMKRRPNLLFFPEASRTPKKSRRRGSRQKPSRTPPHRETPSREPEVSVLALRRDGELEEIIAAITANASTSTSHVAPIHVGVIPPL